MKSKFDGSSAAATTASASAAAPAPPCTNAVVHLGRVGAVLERELADELDLLVVSPGKRLTATTGLSPNSRTIPRWRARFAAPVSIAVDAAVGVAARGA